MELRYWLPSLFAGFLCTLFVQAQPVAAQQAPISTTAPIPEMIGMISPLSLPRAITPTIPITTAPPAVHIVRLGDTLSQLALDYGVELEALIRLNRIADPDQLSVGTQLRIPGGVGGVDLLPAVEISATMPGAGLVARRPITERLTLATQNALHDAPYYNTTWLTFYGRPDVPIMGIIGEHDLDRLAVLLRQQAHVYDQANGPELRVMPAFHLVYGMATRAPGEDGSHLAFLAEEVVLSYIERAQAENFAVILDIQIGALTPVSATAVALPFLQYENVHLAIDPEFALVYPRQTWPGNPIGYVTGAQVNAVQAAMQAYMQEQQIAGQRILLVHQFQAEMIVDSAQIDTGFEAVALTISVDGWGPPYGKITKYNLFVDETTPFAAFKLFYQWDEPLMTPRQALGVDGYLDTHFMETTPNLIIYQ